MRFFIISLLFFCLACQAEELGILEFAEDIVWYNEDKRIDVALNSASEHYVGVHIRRESMICLVLKDVAGKKRPISPDTITYFKSIGVTLVDETKVTFDPETNAASCPIIEARVRSHMDNAFWINIKCFRAPLSGHGYKTRVIIRGKKGFCTAKMREWVS